MGIEPMQRRHFNSLAQMRQRRTVHRIGRVGRSRETGSKDNYKGRVNKVRK
jgi:hypothetical protein